MLHKWASTCVCAAIICVPCAANAGIFNFNFALDGLQETPPVATPAIGAGSVTYDDALNKLDWNISWSGLTGSTGAMHFHGPAPVGINAGVQVNIGAISGLSSPSIGSTIISDTQEADLLGGLWYVNIHSSVYPGGEIRGQVVPEPGALALLGVAALGLRRRRRA